MTFSAKGRRGKVRVVDSQTVPDPEHDIKAPSAFLMMLEGRAPWEFAAMLAAMPILNSAPRGDGHPVVVFPGLGANDVTTVPLRQFLARMGYAAYPWNFGFNFGPRAGVLRACGELVKELQDKHGQQVSLIGWSLGGVYAREIAKEIPDTVRSVITLGTPFTGHPRATNAWRLYELVSGHQVGDPAIHERIRQAPSVPTTSIYSRTDGVVAWQCSINPPAPHTENIEVHASHVGMGMNPAVLFAIADRLAQAPGQWKPFEATGNRKWFYRSSPGAAKFAPPARASTRAQGDPQFA
jgi:pimeloyl-ACP methyl ester carboxylesterase